MFLNLLAQDNYSLRIASGKITSSNFDELATGTIKSHKEDFKVLAFDGGYLLKESLFELPMDFYIKAGFSIFDESYFQDDVYETTLYFKAYWNFDFWKNRFRIGLGEGFSYTDKILYAEYLEAQSMNPVDNNSKILSYMDLSLDLDLGKLIAYKLLYGTNLGLANKHRSGIFGLINNVKKGGSNYTTLYIEKNF